MKTMLRLLLVVGMVIVPILIHAEQITQTQARVSNDKPKEILDKKVTSDKEKKPVSKNPQLAQQQVVPEQSKPTIVSNNTCNPTCICNCYPPKFYAEPITQTQAHVGNDEPKDVLDKKETADEEKNPVDKTSRFDQQQVVPEQSKSTIVSNNTCNPTCICNCYPPKPHMENAREQ